MSAIRVKAAKEEPDAPIIFDVDAAGLDGDRPTQGIVRADGKPVTLNGRHMAVKEALRTGLLVEVKKAKKDDDGTDRGA